jgi:hypothetical protein
MRFSLPLIRGHRTPVSGGGAFLSSPFFATSPLGYLQLGRCSRYVHHPVDVGPEAPVPVTNCREDVFSETNLSSLCSILHQYPASVTSSIKPK